MKTGVISHSSLPNTARNVFLIPTRFRCAPGWGELLPHQRSLCIVVAVYRDYKVLFSPIVICTTIYCVCCLTFRYRHNLDVLNKVWNILEEAKGQPAEALAVPSEVTNGRQTGVVVDNQKRRKQKESIGDDYGEDASDKTESSAKG